MQGNRAALALVVAVVVLAGAWLFFKRTSGASAVQLVPMFDSARKLPAGGTFDVSEADVNGDKRQAIHTMAPSRIIYKTRIPDDAWLKVAVAMPPDTWTQEGNGVQFRFGVSDGRRYDELFRQHVNPFANAGDRKWIQVWVDLSAYAGEEVELIFNADSSPAGQPDDTRNDRALWGDPEIIVR